MSNRCPMCLHPVHLAFQCTQCVCELDAIEAYDAGGGDFEFELPVGSRERMRLEGTLDTRAGTEVYRFDDALVTVGDEDEVDDASIKMERLHDDEGALDTEMDYEDLGTMQY